MSWKKEKPNKWQNMRDYENYLRYRAKYKWKLSYHEYKKNHR